MHHKNSTGRILNSSVHPFQKQSAVLHRMTEEAENGSERGRYLFEPSDLLLQLGFAGAGLIFLQPRSGCAPSLCFGLQLVQL